MRRAIKTEVGSVEDLGHGYKISITKVYDSGYIQPNSYYVWHNNTGVKYLWANERSIKLPRKFRDFLRAYAELTLSIV